MTAPTLQGSLPKAGATHGNTSDIQLYFSEAVQKGAGYIEIRTTSGDALIEQFDVVTGVGSQGGSIKFNTVDVQTVIVPGTKKMKLFIDAEGEENDVNFTFDAGTDPNIESLLQNYSRSTVVLNPGVVLDAGLGYTIKIHSGSVQDYSGNGVVQSTVSFSAADAPPVLVSQTPGNNDVVDLQDNFVLEFNEPVFSGPGTFKLYNAAAPNTIVPSTATFSGNTVTINPTADLLPGAEYFLLIDSNAVRDTASGSNYYAGIKNSSWFRFSTEEGEPVDDGAPVLDNTSITIDDEHEQGAHFRLQFSEVIQAGSGTIKFYEGAVDDSAEFEITLTPGVFFTDDYEIYGNTLKLNTAGEFDEGLLYTLVLPSGVVKDLGNPALGMEAETLSFTVVDNDPEYKFASWEGVDDMVDVNGAIYLAFSETLGAVEGGGSIRLYKEVEGTDLLIADFTVYSNYYGEDYYYGEDAIVADDIVYIDLDGYLEVDNSYYFVIEPDAVTDRNGNLLLGEDEVTTSSFTVFDAAPTLESSRPSIFHWPNQPLEVSQNIQLHFSEEVILHALGEDQDSFIKLYMKDGNEDVLVHTFVEGDISVGNYGEDFVILNPPDPLEADSEYYLLIGDKTFEDDDSDDKFFAGFASPDDFSFTTVDNIPVLGPDYLYYPDSGYTHYYEGEGYVYLYFSEVIYPGDENGTISLYKVGDDDEPVAQIFVDDGEFGSGDGISLYTYSYDYDDYIEVYLNFWDLEQDTEYYLAISPNALQDETGNYFAGMDDDPDTLDQPGYRFRTKNLAPAYIPNDFEESGLDYEQGYFELVFSEAITLATTGTIYLKQEVSAGEFVVVQEFNLANSGLGVNGSGGSVLASGSALMVTPGIPLEIGKSYSVEAAAGLIKDLTGLEFPGFGNAGGTLTIMDFTTFNPVPMLSLIDTGGESDIDVAANIELLFTETIFAVEGGVGHIQIKKVSDDSLVAEFHAYQEVGEDGTLSIEDDRIILDPYDDLLHDTQYYVVIEADTLEDSAGEAVVPILDDLHVFSAQDLTHPEVDLVTTTLDDSDISPNNDLVIYFSEEIKGGAGQIRVVEVDGSVTEDIIIITMNGETGGQTVTGTGGTTLIIDETFGSKITINPGEDLLEWGTEYRVYIDESAFVDLVGNELTGVTSPVLTFHTILGA